MATWQTATLLKKQMIADNVMSLTFSLADWQPFQAGQHFDIRLTSSDGYQAERSYSLANAPEEHGVVEFGVQKLNDGEVSPYLWGVEIGKQIEMRGPIGGHFIWNIDMPGPLILIGGGSGMVPLMSIVRHYLNNKEKDPTREIIFLISARTYGHILYKEELEKISADNPNITIVYTITDEQPEAWSGYSRRVDKEMLHDIASSYITKMPLTYICGPTPFVEAVTKHMLALGFTPHAIKTERFGG